MVAKVRDFSSGYYTTQLEVEEYEHGPTIEEELFQYIDTQLYWNTDTPVLMRGRNGPHFEVDSEIAMPTDVIGLPQGIIDDLSVEAGEMVPHTFFVVKPKHAHYLEGSFFGAFGEEPAGDDEFDIRFR